MKLRVTLLTAVFLVFLASIACAQPTNPPALAIGLTNQIGTNYLLLTVTNHVAGRFYTLYYAYDITTPVRWWIGPYVTGQTNQTNFLILQPEAPLLFLEARNGADQDGDGVPDYQDSDPFDANAGMMQVIIYTPANGSTIQ